MPAVLHADPAPVSDGSYVPEFSSKASGVHLPRVDKMPAFLFGFHRSRWTVVAGSIVPALAKFALVAGCGRVTISPDGRVRFADARAQIEERGWQIIPYEWGPGGSYLRQVRSAPGQGINEIDTYMSAWETAHVGDSETTADPEGYAAWLRELIDAGKLPECPRHIVARMLEARTRALAEAEGHVEQGHSAWGEAVRVLRATVAVLEEALADATPVASSPALPALEG